MRFENQAAQGDILLTRIDALPEGLVPMQANADGEYVVAHSETQHHHVLKDAEVYQDPKDEFKLYVVADNPTVLRHKRSFDTHAPIEIGPGVYRINRQREYTAEGFRRAQD